MVSCMTSNSGQLGRGLGLLGFMLFLMGCTAVAVHPDSYATT